jgi:phosphoribosylanthranilate isomerase
LPMIKIKICGITNLQDAQTAIDLGADALGFNFYKKSPRYIEPTAAKSIIEQLPPLVSLIAIFVDEYSPERIQRIAHAVGIGSVQLHGSESPEYVKSLSELRVIKAFRVNDGFDLNQLSAYSANAFLLDAYEADQFGGTGKTFPWEVAMAAKERGRIILSGGLNEGNIYEAIRTVEPYAVDICSGVECEPGKKAPQKMENLFREIYRARLDLSKAAAN